ncbi:MAG TPA: DUF4112 domain-containing protein [Allocoleopsis sp.]
MSQLPPHSSQHSIEVKTSTIRRLRRLSYMLDSAIPIPGTRLRVGLDPLLGLLPGAGDFLGTALSAYIVIESARLGVPRSALVEMVSNIVLDTVIGTVPVVGDIADVVWKANAKNIQLLEEHLHVPKQRKRGDWLFLALLLVGLLFIVMLIAAISVVILRWLWSAIAG